MWAHRGRFVCVLVALSEAFWGRRGCAQWAIQVRFCGRWVDVLGAFWELCVRDALGKRI